MSLIQSALSAVLPPNRKRTPSGWESFNAPCCHHRGDRRDDRKRGGIMMTGDAFTFHCFNCGFKAGWSPGKGLSQNTRKLFSWLGVPELEISKLALQALKDQDSGPNAPKVFNFDLKEVALPDDTLSIGEWVRNGCSDPELVAAISYILDRGMNYEWYNWMWSPTAGYKDRVIIPYYQDKMIVGYTARKIKPGKPKYLANAQPGYVFNLTAQTWARKYVIVLEGQFDAIAVDGCAIGSNEPNETQVMRINGLSKEVIVVPDRDKPGAMLLKAALENNWSVSLPPWGDDIKDVADAVKRYGRLYVLAAILEYKTNNPVRINLLKKQLEAITDDEK